MKFDVFKLYDNYNHLQSFTSFIDSRCIPAPIVAPRPSRDFVCNLSRHLRYIIFLAGISRYLTQFINVFFKIIYVIYRDIAVIFLLRVYSTTLTRN